jgi:hypothetical protein
MKLLSQRNARTLGAGIGCCAIGLGLVACSSSSSGNSPDGSTGGGGNGTCTTQNLTVVFDPMYSAFISSSSQHTFTLPAIVSGVSQASVKWSASDPTAVGFADDMTTGGTLITVLKAGMFTIAANAGSLCGSAPLNVTQSTDGDWTTGNSRYNNGVTLVLPTMPPMGGFMIPAPTDPSPFEPTDGGPGPACTNCHGPTATMSIFKGIEHTPEQTAGFSDQELIDIVVNGIIPDGGYYDTTIIPYRFWQIFHKWRDITPDQQKGIVTYLRSLTPAPQTGKFDFGGIMPGGGPPPMMMDEGGSTTDDAGETDAAAPTDAGTTPSPDSAPTGDATTD